MHDWCCCVKLNTPPPSGMAWGLQAVQPFVRFCGKVDGITLTETGWKEDFTALDQRAATMSHCPSKLK